MNSEETRRWTLNPHTPESVIQEVLEQHAVRDWPLPQYLLADLAELSREQSPSQGQVDAARIPLLNWFRQEREGAADRAAGVTIASGSGEDVMGRL